MNILVRKTHDHKQVLPRNKLQRLAFLKGYYSGYEFAKAVEAAGITSYGTAFAKWHSGKAEKTQHVTLKRMATFLGASTVEEVFDP